MNPDIIEQIVEQLFAATAAEGTPDDAVDAAILDARALVLSAVDLDAVETEMTTIARTIADNPDSDADDLAAATALTMAVEMIRDERGRRSAQAATANAEREALRARLDGTAPADATDATASTDATDTAAAADAVTTDAAGEALATDAAVVVPDAVVAPVSTRARPVMPDMSAIKANQPADVQAATVLTRKVVHPVAALDVPGVSVGHEFADMRDVAKAFIARGKALGQVRGGGVAVENVPIAQFSYIDSLKQLTDDGAINGLMLMDAGREDALTAAGGFCAPAETVYGFVKVNTPSGLVQDFLPTVGAPRGSIQYPKSPDIRDAFTANPSRAYTLANDIAGTSKAVTTVACPTFAVCQVGAQYTILKFGNFATRAYPEWVEHWIGLSMDVQAHQTSAKLIGQMIVLSNPIVSVGPNGGATATIFGNIGMAAADMRSDLRMADDSPLEVVLPIWIDDLIRSDLARARKGQLDDTLNVTDARIAQWFAVLNVIPRYVTDWQTVSGTATTGTTVWPSGLQFLIYPPGTFVLLDMGVLDLGVVRDSTLNTTNDYTIFVETFQAVCKPGIESRLYSMSICANGAFSADQNLGCTAIDIPGS